MTLTKTIAPKQPRVRIGFSAPSDSVVVANIDTINLDNHVPLPGWPAPQWGESPIFYAARAWASKAPLPARAACYNPNPRDLANLAAWLVISGKLQSPQTLEACELLQERLGVLSEAWRVTRGIQPWSPDKPWVCETDHPQLALLRKLGSKAPQKMEACLAAWLAGNDGEIHRHMAKDLLDSLLNDPNPSDGEEEAEEGGNVRHESAQRAAAEILRLIPQDKQDDLSAIMRRMQDHGEEPKEIPEPRVSGIVAIVDDPGYYMYDIAVLRGFGTRPVVYQVPAPSNPHHRRGSIYFHMGLRSSGIQLHGKPADLREILLKVRTDLQLNEDPSTGTSWTVEIEDGDAHYCALHRWCDQPENEDDLRIRDRWIVAHLNNVLQVPGLSKDDSVLSMTLCNKLEWVQVPRDISPEELPLPPSDDASSSEDAESPGEIDKVMGDLHAEEEAP